MICPFCSYEFPDECGKYGCPNCNGEGLEDTMHNCDSCHDNTEINCHDCEQMQHRIEDLCAQGTRGGLSQEEEAELQRLVAKEKADKIN